MNNRYEYQGDRYRGLIIDIRKCEELLRLYEELEVSVNSKTWQRACEIRDMFWGLAEDETGLDEFDVLYDVKNFEDSPRVNPPAIYPTVCTL